MQTPRLGSFSGRFESVLLPLLLLLGMGWRSGGVQAQGLGVEVEPQPIAVFDASSPIHTDMVYHVMQDSRGLIWLSTDRGAYRYDGYSFHPYTIREGLTATEVFNSVEDGKGRVWLQLYGTGIAYVDSEGRLHTSQNDSTLKHWDLGGQVGSMKVDERGVLHGATITGQVFRFDESPESGKGTFPCTPHVESLVHYKGQSTVLFSCVGNTMDPGHLIPIHAPISARYIYVGKYVLDKDVAQRGEEAILVGAGGATVLNLKSLEIQDLRFDPAVEDHAFKPNFVQFLDDSTLWFGENSGLHLLQRRNDSLVYLNPYLRNVRPSGLMRDSHGNIWMSTLDQGVLVYDDFDLTSDYRYEPQIQLLDDKPAYSLHPTDSILYVAGAYPLLKRFQMSDMTEEPAIPFSPKTPFYETQTPIHLADVGEGILGVFAKKYMNLYHGGRMYARNSGSEKEIVYFPGTRFFILGNGAKLRIAQVKLLEDMPLQDSLKGIFREANEEYDMSLFDLEPETGKPAVYVASSRGVAEAVLVDGKAKIRYLIQEKDLPYHSLKLDSLGRLWALSKGRRLTVIDQGIEYNMPSYPWLATTENLALRLGEENSIWVMHGTGWANVFFSPDDHHFSYKEYGGMPQGTKIHDFLPYKNGMLIASETGLQWMEFREREAHLPNLNLDLSAIEGASGKSRSRFAWWQNKIEIGFTAIQYPSAQEVVYSYRLLPTDSTWQQTQVRSINYQALPAGDYEFEVKASANGLDWTPTERFSFQIATAFWNTWWFYSLLAVAISGVLTLLFVSALRRQKRKSDIQIKLLEAEQQALRAQMNPHFIFNALNSIQTFILDEESLAAYEYLEAFSRLIRMILDFSRRKTIRLEEELEMLRIYVSLEALRFDQPFVFQEEIDPEVNLQAKIPPMLFQPFFENAIWHGLLPLQGREAILKLSLKREGEGIRVRIEDNGIGRKAAAEQRAKSHKAHQSVGMKITRHRILAGNPNQNLLEIHDLYDTNGNSVGTRVEFVIFG